MLARLRSELKLQNKKTMKHWISHSSLISGKNIPFYKIHLHGVNIIIIYIMYVHMNGGPT